MTSENKEKLYYCPECGTETTAAKIAEDIVSGGYGLCMCQYGNGSRILVSYLPVEDRMMELTVDEIKLINLVRKMRGD